MIKLIKKWLIKKAIGILKGKIESLEQREARLHAFRDRLYHNSMPDFAAWGIAELEKDNKIPEGYSFVEYLKELIEPLDDELEGVILEIIEELEP